MSPEIGSEFELDPARLATPPRPQPGWLGAEDTRHVASGREGLRLLLRARGGGRLVLPAYLCESVAEAALGAGSWEVVYVPVDESLAPDPSALADALTPDAVAVRVQVFSRPLPPAVDEALDASGATVIEDCTHSLLSREPRRPLAFASVRKWLPVPDGGVARGHDGPLDPADEAGAEEKSAAQQAKHRFLRTGEGDKPAFRGVMGRHEAALDTVRTVRAASRRARQLLASADLEAVRAQRRANHDALRAALVGSPVIADLLTPLEPPLGDDDVPLGLPVVCRDRDGLRRWLIQHAIYPPVHWPLPDAVLAGPFPVAQRRVTELMTLVIDQRYDAEDMARVAGLVEEYARR